jgi:starvation-inducible DNA-binding protein
MSDILETVPAATKVASGVAGPKPVAEALARALADTYLLLLKTHACHWNVEGPLFYGVHVLTEAQYNDLFAATDALAERIRGLGLLAPMSPAEILGGAVEARAPARPSTRAMLEALAEDHTALAKRLHGLFDLAEKHKDPVTADLATRRSAFHEKAAWMLRALTA